VGVTVGEEHLDALRVSWLLLLAYGGGVLVLVLVLVLVVAGVGVWVRQWLDDPLLGDVATVVIPFAARLGVPGRLGVRDQAGGPPTTAAAAPGQQPGPSGQRDGGRISDILEGRIQPGRVFDRTVTLDEVPSGYQAMADREALKVIIQP
jgi:hypothetical protein